MDIPDTVEFNDVLNHVIDWQDEKKLEFHLESWPDSRYLMIMFKRGGDSSIFHIDVMNTNRLQWIFFGRTLALSKQVRDITISFSGFHDVETLRDYIYSFFNKFITRQDIREIKIIGIVSDESLSVFPLSKFARTRKYFPRYRYIVCWTHYFTWPLPWNALWGWCCSNCKSYFRYTSKLRGIGSVQGYVHWIINLAH